MALPPMTTVARMLRTTTEYLAGELALPQATAPDWSALEWRTARAVTAMHGISGLLAVRLRWQGPLGWAEFLRSQHGHITERQARIEALLRLVADRCRQEGIPVQALKGAALCLEGVYRAGERPMADLDLLAPRQDTERLGRVLETLGLQETHRTFKHRVFEAPDAPRPSNFGEHAGNDLKIELHDRICEILPHRQTDISHLVLPRAAVAGLNPYPSRAALIAHLLLHAAGAMASRSLRLIQLHDIDRLGRHLAEEDWQWLLDWRPWWAWPVLALSARYFGEVMPPQVASGIRALCPVLLRHACARQRLSDVSLSRLWLEAFPGIEWAHTISEAVAFFARRIVPSAELLSERKFELLTDPTLARCDWAGLSQSRRILRALRSRTPRPRPLYNVREALAGH